MRIFWFLIYNVLIFPVLFIGTQIASLFSAKVRKGLKGRKQSLAKTKEFMAGIDSRRPIILFHCASMGEYEQIRPVLLALKQERPDILRVVSFFSPSGFEFVDKDSEYDHKEYLPIDFLPSVNRFLNILCPKAVVISKHDVWPNLVWALTSRKIPVLLVNATMPLNSTMTRPVARWFFRAAMGELRVLAPASEADANGFAKIVPWGLDLKVLGDTRYDQVLNRVTTSRGQKVLPPKAFEGKKVFVAGSTWPSDETHLIPAAIRLLKAYPYSSVIWVPHEIESGHLAVLKDEFRTAGIECVLFSDPDLGQKLSDSRVLIVDKIGHLAELYGYGHVAYVGGSFGPGVHNVMEPAAHGIPVLFGPRNLNSPEAGYLKENGAGFQVNTSEEAFDRLASLLLDNDRRTRAGKEALDLIKVNQGATGRIVHEILMQVHLFFAA